MTKKLKRISDLTDKICHVCGSSGYSDTIATCSKCNDSEHLYCMKNPRFCFPPEWSCNVCCSKPVEKQPLVKGNYNPAVTSKVKFINLPEVHQKYNSKRKSLVAHIPPRAHAVKLLLPASAVSPRTLTNPPANQNQHPEIQLETSSPETETKTKNQTDLLQPSNYTCEASSSISIAAPSKSGPSPMKKSEVVALRFTDTNDVPLESKPADSPNSNFKRHLTVLIPNAIFSDYQESGAHWKGVFELLNVISADSYDEILAYYASCMSQKAYEAAKLLPDLLRLKVVKRLDVWPKMFAVDPPDRDDIALSFIPKDNERSKIKYSRLLERINSQDLGMQCRLGKVELLLFSSTQLPVSHQQLNGDFFIWGVFRPSKNHHLDVVPSPNHHLDVVPSPAPPSPIQETPRARFCSPLLTSPGISPSRHDAAKSEHAISPSGNSLERNLPQRLPRVMVPDEVISESSRALPHPPSADQAYQKETISDRNTKNSSSSMHPTGPGAAIVSDNPKRPSVSFSLKKPCFSGNPPGCVKSTASASCPPVTEKTSDLVVARGNDTKGKDASISNSRRSNYPDCPPGFEAFRSSLSGQRHATLDPRDAQQRKANLSAMEPVSSSGKQRSRWDV